MYNATITLALRTLSTLFPPQKPLVFSGAEASKKLAHYMVVGGSKKPLLVTDSFLYQNGMLDGLLTKLEEMGCQATVFDGIIPNPTFEVVEKGLSVCNDNDCDAVFAVGGGSAIDTAKVIAAASANAKPLNKLAGLLKLRKPLLPFYVVPTTSGTGSEVTTAAVISDSETHKKKFFVDPKYIPIATAFDTNLLKSLPPEITAATGMDALTHALEAFTSKNNFADTDQDAAMAVRLLFKFLPKAYENGEDLEAREMVALASFLAGYAFTKSSLGYVHAISHQVSAHYNTPHGLANAVILPRVLRFNKKSAAARYAQLEKKVGGNRDNKTDQEMADLFIARVDRLSEQVGIPQNLPEVLPEDYSSIAKDALKEARTSYAVPKVMSKQQVTEILKSVSSGKKEISFG